MGAGEALARAPCDSRTGFLLEQLGSVKRFTPFTFFSFTFLFDQTFISFVCGGTHVYKLPAHHLIFWILTYECPKTFLKSRKLRLWKQT